MPVQRPRFTCAFGGPDHDPMCSRLGRLPGLEPLDPGVSIRVFAETGRTPVHTAVYRNKNLIDDIAAREGTTHKLEWLPGLESTAVFRVVKQLLKVS